MQTLHGRKALEDLRKTERYVFHGSPDPGIEWFTPRKAMSRAELNNEPVEWDDDYIFATDYIDVAIFAAVVFHLGNSGWYANTETNPVTFTFNADPDVALKAKESVGYVYVFLKELFEPSEKTLWEYVTTHEVSPLYCVEVGGSDVRPQLDDLKPDPNPHH